MITNSLGFYNQNPYAGSTFASAGNGISHSLYALNGGSAWPSTISTVTSGGHGSPYYGGGSYSMPQKQPTAYPVYYPFPQQPPQANRYNYAPTNYSPTNYSPRSYSNVSPFDYSYSNYNPILNQTPSYYQPDNNINNGRYQPQGYFGTFTTQQGNISGNNNNILHINIGQDALPFFGQRPSTAGAGNLYAPNYYAPSSDSIESILKSGRSFVARFDLADDLNDTPTYLGNGVDPLGQILATDDQTYTVRWTGSGWQAQGFAEISGTNIDDFSPSDGSVPNEFRIFKLPLTVGQKDGTGRYTIIANSRPVGHIIT